MKFLLTRCQDSFEEECVKIAVSVTAYDGLWHKSEVKLTLDKFNILLTVHRDISLHIPIVVYTGQ